MDAELLEESEEDEGAINDPDGYISDDEIRAACKKESIVV